MNRTRIEWVRGPDGGPGYTWNPIVGCSRGCDYCYARRLAKRMRGRCEKCYQFEPHMHHERMFDPGLRGRPKGIFVCSMGELFDPALGHGEALGVLSAMCTYEQHRYYLLTKRPGRMREVLTPAEPRRNWWLGVSVSTQAEADERIPELLRLREDGREWPVLFVSVEPILGPVDLRPYLQLAYYRTEGGGTSARFQNDGLDWVIVGAQTGPGALPPSGDWVERLVEQCREAAVPAFVKGNTRRAYLWAIWVQEMPKR